MSLGGALRGSGWPGRLTRAALDVPRVPEIPIDPDEFPVPATAVRRAARA